MVMYLKVEIVLSQKFILYINYLIKYELFNFNRTQVSTLLPWNKNNDVLGALT
jgi:hypothetical protein